MANTISVVWAMGAGIGAPGNVWKRDISVVMTARVALDKTLMSKGIASGLQCSVDAN